MPEVTIRLLGGFEVRVGDREVGPAGWPGRRAAELVALLALADGRRLLRDQVIEALWPHLDPRAGAANLRKAAHHARRALARDDAIVLAGGRVTLLPDDRVFTDVDEFERLADEALATGDAAACSVAADAYAGPLLPESLYDDWSAAHRDHLRERHLAVLRAGRLWDRLAAADPTDEPAHRQLMAAALAAGNRHGAIRWYGRLRTALEQDLGVAPSPETRALYERCVADSARPGLRSSAGRSSWPGPAPPWARPPRARSAPWRSADRRVSASRRCAGSWRRRPRAEVGARSS